MINYTLDKLLEDIAPFSDARIWNQLVDELRGLRDSLSIEYQNGYEEGHEIGYQDGVGSCQG